MGSRPLRCRHDNISDSAEVEAEAVFNRGLDKIMLDKSRPQVRARVKSVMCLFAPVSSSVI